MDLSRLEMLIGPEGLEALAGATVDIFGIGGVGGLAFEAVVRSGVGRVRLYDYDVVTPSNINRQIISTQDVMGRPKVEVAAERARAINPDIKVESVDVHLEPGNIDVIMPDDCRYAIDAIDEVRPKTALLELLYRREVRCITSTGAGNRLDPSRVEVRDLFDTRGDPLARVMRRELRRQGIEKGVPCVVSSAPSLEIARDVETTDGNRRVGSSPWLPGIFGLTAASWIVRAILRDAEESAAG